MTRRPLLRYPVSPGDGVDAWFMVWLLQQTLGPARMPGPVPQRRTGARGHDNGRAGLN